MSEKFGKLCRTILLSLYFTLTACATYDTKASVCLLDFDAQRCWIDKKNKIGISFDIMREQQILCQDNVSIPCYYGVDSFDILELGSK